MLNKLGSKRPPRGRCGRCTAGAAGATGAGAGAAAAAGAGAAPGATVPGGNKNAHWTRHTLSASTASRPTSVSSCWQLTRND